MLSKRFIRPFFAFFMILALCQVHAEDIIRRKVGPSMSNGKKHLAIWKSSWRSTA